MKIFLVDSENVCWHGIEGFEELDPEDIVYYFSTPVRDNSTVGISENTMFKMLNAKAKLVKIMAYPSGQKNYLDDCIKTELGRLFARNEEAEAIIVSKDQGYLATIDYWCRQGRKVSLAESIARYLHPEIKVKIVMPVASKTKAKQEKSQQELIEEIVMAYRPKTKEDKLPAISMNLMQIKKEKGLKNQCKSLFKGNSKIAFEKLQDIILQS